MGPNPNDQEVDLEDLSPAIRTSYTNRARQHKELEQHGALKEAMHGYLASISFADAMLGRLQHSNEIQAGVWISGCPESR